MTASAAKQTGLGLGVFSLALGAAEVAAPQRIAKLFGLAPDGTAKTVLGAFGLREIAAAPCCFANRVYRSMAETARLAIRWIRPHC